MGRAFTPSRSAIYGSPDRQAMVGVADQVMGILSDLGAQQVAAENYRQESNASIAMMQKRHELDRMMEENAKDPLSWKPAYQKQKKGIRDAVMKGVTQPGARQKVEVRLNESMAAWDIEIENASAKQSAWNANADFGVNAKTLIETPVFDPKAGEENEERLQSHINHYIDHVAAAHEIGVTAVATPVLADAAIRDGTRAIVSGYVLQQAAELPEEEGLKAIEAANEHADVFAPEDIAALKKTYKSAVKAADAQANRERAERAETFDSEMTVKQLSGQVTAEDREAIINNEDLSPTRKTTMTNQHDAIVDGYAKGKEYDEQDRLEARIEVDRARGYEEKMAVLMKNAPILGDTLSNKLYEKINNPAESAADDVAGDYLEKTITAIRQFETARIKDVHKKDADGRIVQEATAKTNAVLARMEVGVREQWDAHPEWTVQQRIDAAEAAMAPAKDELGKQAVKQASWGAKWDKFWEGKARYGTWAPMPQIDQAKQAKQGEEAKQAKQGEEAKQAKQGEEAMTATNASTGERIYWNGSEWLPLE